METFYLDTHVAMWLYFGESESLSQTARTLIRESQLLISPIVKLELQYLRESEKMTVTPHAIFETLYKEFGIQSCKKGFVDVIAEALQHNWTRDPFDRIITAQASLGGDALLTKDRSILENYSKAIW